MNLSTSPAGLFPPINSMWENLLSHCCKKCNNTSSICIASSRVGVTITAPICDDNHYHYSMYNLVQSTGPHLFEYKPWYLNDAAYTKTAVSSELLCKFWHACCVPSKLIHFRVINVAFQLLNCQNVSTLLTKCLPVLKLMIYERTNYSSHSSKTQPFILTGSINEYWVVSFISWCCNCSFSHGAPWRTTGKGRVVCWQVKLCDPHLSALEARFSWRGAIQIHQLYLYLLVLLNNMLCTKFKMQILNGSKTNLKMQIIYTQRCLLIVCSQILNSLNL